MNLSASLDFLQTLQATFRYRVYTQEQQERLSVNEFGNYMCVSLHPSCCICKCLAFGPGTQKHLVAAVDHRTRCPRTAKPVRHLRPTASISPYPASCKMGVLLVGRGCCGGNLGPAPLSPHFPRLAFPPSLDALLVAIAVPSPRQQSAPLSPGSPVPSSCFRVPPHPPPIFALRALLPRPPSLPQAILTWS